MNQKTCTCKENECCSNCPKPDIKFISSNVNEPELSCFSYDFLKKQVIETTDMPVGARDLEVFHIDADKKEAYIGYKLANGNFHFITVPYTGD